MKRDDPVLFTILHGPEQPQVSPLTRSNCVRTVLEKVLCSASPGKTKEVAVKVSSTFLKLRRGDIKKMGLRQLKYVQQVLDNPLPRQLSTEVDELIVLVDAEN